MKARSKHGFLACAIALAGLLPAVVAVGQVRDSVERVIAFEGYLTVDGLSATATMPMRFTIYDAVGEVQWTEEWSGDDAVALTRGNFSVALGRTVDIQPTIYDAEELFIGIELQAADETWFTLEGRQQLMPVPWATWATTAADIEVAGNVNTGSATVTGNFAGDRLTTPQLTATNSGGGSGNLSVTGGIDGVSDLSVGGSASFDSTLAADDIYFAGVAVDLESKTAFRITSTALLINPDSDFSLINVPSRTMSIGNSGASIAIGGTLAITSKRDGSSSDNPALELASGDGWEGHYYEFAIEADSTDTTHSLFRSTYLGPQGSSWFVSTIPSYGLGDVVEDYACWVGGLRLTNTDINENDLWSYEPVEAIPMTHRSGDTDLWGANVEIVNHGPGTHEVVLVCVQGTLGMDSSQFYGGWE